MVNDPLDSTVVQFARSPVAGRPFTISETNHPFPHRFACEGFSILTAYALFQDWDGLLWFDWGPGRIYPAKGVVQVFGFGSDPVKYANAALCGLWFHRGDVRPARETVVASCLCGNRRGQPALGPREGAAVLHARLRPLDTLAARRPLEIHRGAGPGLSARRGNRRDRQRYGRVGVAACGRQAGTGDRGHAARPRADRFRPPRSPAARHICGPRWTTTSVRSSAPAWTIGRSPTVRGCCWPPRCASRTPA